MKKRIQIALLGLSLVSVIAFASENLSLDSRIDGEASASGLFPTQEAEEEYKRSLMQAETWELEPCINGQVSASGLFPTQEAEDQYRMIEELQRIRSQLISLIREQ